MSSILSNLHFVEHAPATSARATKDPFAAAKVSLAEALSVQQKLVADPEFTFARRSKTISPRKWWIVGEDGTTAYITLRCGIQKMPVGKNECIQTTVVDLNKTYRLLADALARGEMDQAIKTALTARQTRGKK